MGWFDDNHFAGEVACPTPSFLRHNQCAVPSADTGDAAVRRTTSGWAMLLATFPQLDYRIAT
eukprot:2213557-Rhodomonas_salina.3